MLSCTLGFRVRYWVEHCPRLADGGEQTGGRGYGAAPPARKGVTEPVGRWDTATRMCGVRLPVLPLYLDRVELARLLLLLRSPVLPKAALAARRALALLFTMTVPLRRGRTLRLRAISCLVPSR